MKSSIKKLFFGTKRELGIKAGVAKDVKMVIDPQHKLQRLFGLDEREIAKPFQELSEKYPVFVDIGASDGYYGLIYAKHNPKGSLILIDANEAYQAVQRKNLEVNGVQNRFYLVSKYVAAEVTDSTIAVDPLLEDKGLSDKPVFFKIDVDGGEVEVIKGISTTLKNKNCGMILETHSKELEQTCIEHLHALGYQTRIIDNAWWRIVIPERRPIPHNRWLVAEKAANMR